MTDRNHAVEAARLLGPDHTPARVERATAHAVLAVAEQLRVSNLIALARVESENQTTPTDALLTIYDKQRDGSVVTRPEIRKALRIDD